MAKRKKERKKERKNGTYHIKIYIQQKERKKESNKAWQKVAAFERPAFKYAWKVKQAKSSKSSRTNLHGGC